MREQTKTKNSKVKGIQVDADLVTLDELMKTVLPRIVSPVPPRSTLREWFMRLPQFKANPNAKRGGGPVYYSIAAVEKFFEKNTIPSLQVGAQ